MQNGASAEKMEALMGKYRKSPLFSVRERLALELAERMTYTSKRVTDKFFKRLQRHFTNEELVELAAVIAFENFRSKFNPVFGIESQGFCPLPVVKAAASAATDRFSR
jgi:alkylhydroperoxidase family enzyme